MKWSYLLVTGSLVLSGCRAPLDETVTFLGEHGVVVHRGDTPKHPPAASPRPPSHTERLPLAAPASPKLTENRVGKALAEARCFNAQPLPDARCYVYVQERVSSADAIMPKLVKLYPKLRRDNVELIILFDETGRNDAIQLLKKYKAKFPALLVKDTFHLPAFKLSRTLPYVTFVTPDGKIVKKGDVSLLKPLNH